MFLNKIDVRPILRGHMATLRDNAFESPSLADLALFFGLPALLGLSIVVAGFRFRVDAINGFLNVFAILTGLLLNLLVLVLAIAAGKTPQNVDYRKRARLIREIFSNICFSVLNSTIVVCVALVALSYMRSNSGATAGPVATFLLCSLTSNFVLTLFMVLKRMYILLIKELRQDHPPTEVKAA